MLRHDIYIELYDWRITVFYSVTCYYTCEIISALRAIDCDSDSLSRAYRNIASCSLDTGLTYSNRERRESVMVIGQATSPEQYANSIAHESQHLIKHIALAEHLDPFGEEICYLAGYIAQQIHHHASQLLCTHCLQNTKDRLSH